MDLTLRIVVALFALLFLIMGVNLMLAPVSGAEGMAVTPIGEAGLSTLRGDLGGLFVGSALLLVLGLIQRKAEWFLAVAVLMALIALGRLLGFVLDGNPSQPTLIAFGFELVITCILVLASRKLPAKV